MRLVVFESLLSRSILFCQRLDKLFHLRSDRSVSISSTILAQKRIYSPFDAPRRRGFDALHVDSKRRVQRRSSKKTRDEALFKNAFGIGYSR